MLHRAARRGLDRGRARCSAWTSGAGASKRPSGTPSTWRLATSAAVGPARLRGELGTGDPLSVADRMALRRPDRGDDGTDRQGRRGLPRGVADRTVVSGGTVRALARLATARARRRPSAGPGEVNQVELPAHQVLELADQLAGLDLRARLALPGMQARRAPLLPGGRGRPGHRGVRARGGTVRGERMGTARGGDPRRPGPSLSATPVRPGTCPRSTAGTNSLDVAERPTGAIGRRPMPA